MELIKVGNRVINMELVTDVMLENKYEPGQLRVVFTEGSIDFKGQEAEALRYYFKGNSRDAVAEYEGYLQQQDFLVRRQEWERAFEKYRQERKMEDFNHWSSLKSYLYHDGDLLEPNQENYDKWQDWLEENKHNPYF